ncbi:putative RNA-directed DNA polymerase from transposon X-element [Trichonephila inaurata madagascariensis]|uniref:Putative RNA-directed DNA polymerase from transposon X-element n=1 Tax=Trichonephila inaurata madagascariensis TaxID=2747483 RepID=A0A8X6Y0L4_9ARAC|nr:putative RNA-directed DNA polymerase from transposon X-element [Trichonephila inaurata madagascariensis]
MVPATLLEDRVRDALVLEVIGVDLAGLLYLKNGNKAWIVLFTCAVYRAVHLELIQSLSTDGFSLGLRRFIARRGRPMKIYSDNGTNFIGADNKASLDWKKLLKRPQF